MLSIFDYIYNDHDIIEIQIEYVEVSISETVSSWCR